MEIKKKLSIERWHEENWQEQLKELQKNVA